MPQSAEKRRANYKKKKAKNAALKAAMKARDAKTLSTLRLVTAALKDRDIQARSEGSEDEISDAEVLALLQKMIKQRRESIKMFDEAGKTEAAAGEAEEIAVIERFLPKALSDDETKEAIAALIEELQPTGMQDMGKIVGALKTRFAGQVDMAKAAPLVKQALA